jgi:DNA-binding NtrC family response regulator
MGALKKILVVDDERGIRFLLESALSGAGYQVSTAKDGRESLEQLQGARFDLVITDIQMPELDGIEMLRQMKRAGRKEKVIIMTGNPSDHRLQEADIPPVVTRLKKPFMIDSLLSIVLSAMGNSGKMVGLGNRQFAAANEI